jgi:hypothetical protein
MHSSHAAMEADHCNFAAHRKMSRSVLKSSFCRTFFSSTGRFLHSTNTPGSLPSNSRTMGGGDHPYSVTMGITGACKLPELACPSQVGVVGKTLH